MLKLMEEGYGVKKSIPQMILAGASVDDVFVIVMFTAFTGLAQGDQVSAVDFINIDNNATVRQTAKQFGISKSTVHIDVTKRNGKDYC